MKSRRFEFRAGTSSKFWEAAQDGSAVVVRYGRIGTDGRELRKEHPSDAKALAAYSKLVAEKLKEGYVEIGSASATPAKAAPPPPAAPARLALPPSWPANVYLVSRRLSPATATEVDRLEKKAGFAMPSGYRQLVTALGGGQFCDELSFYSPKDAIKNLADNRRLLRDVYKAREDDDEEQNLPLDEIREAVQLGGGPGNAFIIACPGTVGSVHVWPEENEIEEVSTGFLDPRALGIAAGVLKGFSWFEPNRPAWRGGHTFIGAATPAEIIKLIEKTFADGRVIVQNNGGRSKSAYERVFIESLGGFSNVSRREDRIEFHAVFDEGQESRWTSFLATLPGSLDLKEYKEPEDLRPKPLAVAKIGNPPKLKPDFELPHPNAATWLAFTPDGSMLATSPRSFEDKDTVWMWDLKTGKRVGEPIRLKSSAPMAVFSPDGRTLAIGRREEVLLIDAATGKEIRRFTVHEPCNLRVQGLDFSADGRMLISRSSSEEAAVWDLKTQKRLAHVSKPETADPVTLARFLSDGTAVFVGTEVFDGVMREMMTGKEIGRVHASHTLHDTELSADGATLVLHNINVDVWDVKTGSIRLHIEEGGNGLISKVALSDDGRWLAVGRQDAASTLWDLTSQQSVATLSGGEDSVRLIAFNAASDMLALLDDDIVRVWRLPSK